MDFVKNLEDLNIAERANTGSEPITSPAKITFSSERDRDYSSEHSDMHDERTSFEKLLDDVEAAGPDVKEFAMKSVVEKRRWLTYRTMKKGLHFRTL